MQNKSFSFVNKISFSILIILGLALVRAFENSLFYDPFLQYFKYDYHNLPLPKINNIQFIIGIFFRYFLNTILSLALIYVLFRDVEALQFASVLYVVFFVLLLTALLFVIYSTNEPNKMMLFYVRRFLIQPIFILLFLPAFYYQRLKG